MQLSRRKDAVKEWLILPAGALVTLGAYEVLAILAGLPRILAVGRGVQSLWQSGLLPHDIAVTGARWMIGWIVGLAPGVALGLLTGRIGAFRLGLEGFLILLRGVPFVAILPLMIELFGLSEAGKIGLVAFACFTTAWLIVHTGAKSVPFSTKWRTDSLGIRGGRHLRIALLPACKEFLWAATRTTLGLGLLVVAVAEMTGVYERSSDIWWSEGLGYRGFRTQEEGQDAQMIATIAVFATLAIVGDRLLVLFFWVSGRLARWHAIARARREVLGAAKAAASKERVTPNSLTVRNLRAWYDGMPVIEGFSMDVAEGSTIAVLGRSGSGKSTLLRAIGGLAGGGFRWQGEIRGAAQSRMDVGLVLQGAPTFEQLTVWEHVQVGERLRALSKPQRTARAKQLLERFGLINCYDQCVETLSTGQRQRVAFATAIANQPKLLLLDEPFSNLDYAMRLEMQRFFRENIYGNSTAVFVTHDPDEALLVADSVIVGFKGSHRVAIERTPGDFAIWLQSREFVQQRAKLLSKLRSGGT